MNECNELYTNFYVLHSYYFIFIVPFILISLILKYFTSYNLSEYIYIFYFLKIYIHYERSVTCKKSGEMTEKEQLIQFHLRGWKFLAEVVSRLIISNFPFIGFTRFTLNLVILSLRHRGGSTCSDVGSLDTTKTIKPKILSYAH